MLFSNHRFQLIKETEESRKKVNYQLAMNLIKFKLIKIKKSIKDILVLKFFNKFISYQKKFY